MCVFTALCLAFNEPTIATHMWNCPLHHLYRYCRQLDKHSDNVSGVVPLFFTLLLLAVTQTSHYTTPPTVFMARLCIIKNFSAWSQELEAYLAPYPTLFRFARDYSAFQPFCLRSQCCSISPPLFDPNLSRVYLGPLSFPFPAPDIHTEC